MDHMVTLILFLLFCYYNLMATFITRNSCVGCWHQLQVVAFPSVYFGKGLSTTGSEGSGIWRFVEIWGSEGLGVWRSGSLRVWIWDWFASPTIKPHFIHIRCVDMQLLCASLNVWFTTIQLYCWIKQMFGTYHELFVNGFPANLVTFTTENTYYSFNYK